MSVEAMKKLTGDAPLYLLGPLVTDIAPGYDHIVGAIGGAVAGLHGADFLCMVTPSEHLALPTADDIREGTIVTRIAAHVADTVKEGQRDHARAQDLATNTTWRSASGAPRAWRARCAPAACRKTASRP
jgi:phosphomethylpyrimidine synthase